MTVLSFPSVLPAEVEWTLQSRSQTNRSPLTGSVQTLELVGALWVASLTFPDNEAEDGRAVMAFLAALRGEAGRFYLHRHDHPTPAGTAAVSPGPYAKVNGASGDVNALEPVGETVIALANMTRTIITGEYVKFSNHDDVYEVVSGGSSSITIEATGLTTEIYVTTDIEVYHQGPTLKTDGWATSSAIFKAGDFIGVNNELKIITADVTSDGSGNADLPIAPILRDTIIDNTNIITNSPTAIMKLVDDNQAKARYYKTSITSITINCEEAFV